MAILPNAIYKFNAIPNKITAQFFIEFARAIYKFIWNNKEPRIAKSIVNSKKKKKKNLVESQSLTSTCTTEQWR
jgi:hypothetical protein